MYCIKCGAKMEEGQACCSACGNMQETGGSAHQGVKPNNMLSSGKMSNTKKVACLLLVIVFGVAGYFGFAYTQGYFAKPDQKAVNANKTFETDQGAIRDLLLMYTAAWAEAVNKNDFSLAEKYLLPGSELYDAQKALFNDLQKDGIRLELVKTEVGDAVNQSREEAATIDAVEEYNVFFPDGKKQVSRCFWTYTVNYVDGQGWKLSKIAKSPRVEKTAEKVRVTTRDYNEGWIHVKYPQIEGMISEAAQNKINDVLKKLADDFVAGMTGIGERSKSYPNYNRFMADMGYTVKWQSDDVVSIVCVTGTYTGGAHGAQTEIGYTFDLRSGEQISLREKVGNEKIQVYNEMIAQQIRARNLHIFEPFKGISDRTTYYLLDENRLMVVFQQYEIAPYSSGILRFELPY